MPLTDLIKSVPQKVSAGAQTALTTVNELREATDFASAVDVMTEAPQSFIEERVNRLRLENPEATPAEIIGILSRKFYKSSGATSAGTGAVAAFPGLGTVAGLGVSSAQFLAFLAQAGIYVLSVAHIYGIPTENRELRRMLVMSSILGEDATELLTAKLGFSSIGLLRSSFAQLGTNVTAKANSLLANRLKKLLVRKGATSIFGKVMPFGVGAGIGWWVGNTMAREVIRGTSYFLGPIPTSFAFDVTPILDAEPTQKDNS